MESQTLTGMRHQDLPAPGQRRAGDRADHRDPQIAVRSMPPGTVPPLIMQYSATSADHAARVRE
jgi:hypothetical protein